MAFFIISMIAGIFAFCFLIAAIFIFATRDTQPLDRETERLLSYNVWFGGGWLPYVHIFSRNWKHCQPGRRCFYAALSFGAFALGLGTLAAHW